MMRQERVAIYNRCSTEEEAQVNALSIQAAESREKALELGWQIVDQYIESESGTTSEKRREYKRLLADMEGDGFDIVMIKSIDRLMRSAKDWYLFLDRLTQCHKKLYIYLDNKFYTPDDSLITGIKAILAEDFSRELSKKIRNSHKRRQTLRSGLNITREMFGWDKVGKDAYVINEAEAEAYREAFEIIKSGKGFYSLANEMYGRGVRGKSGRRISAVQWRKMLYSTRAHGTVTLHTTEYDFNAKKRYQVPQQEWIYVQNALPPIVDASYHREFLEMLLTRTEKNTFSDYTRDMTKAGLHELSGKLYCKSCGRVYYRTTFHSKIGELVEWKCSKAITTGRKTEENPDGCNNINVIEQVVTDAIQSACKKQYEVMFGKEEGMIEEALAVIRKVIRQDDHGSEKESAKKEIEHLQKKNEVLFYKLMDEVITDADFKKYHDELSEKIKKLEQKIADINAGTQEYNGYEERLAKIRQALEEDIVDRAKTKELILRIDKIWVCPDGTLEIVFDKTKLLSLLKVYSETIAWDEPDDNFFKIIVPYEHKNNIKKRREAVKQKILMIWKEDPEIMLKEIPEKAGVSASYVNTCVKELKKNGRIRYQRNGNTHTGKWVVNEPQ